MKLCAPIVGVCLAAACAGGGCATFALGDKPEPAAAGTDHSPPPARTADASTAGRPSSEPGKPPANQASAARAPGAPSQGAWVRGDGANSKRTPTAATGIADAAAMTEILAELQTLGAIEPDAQQRLIEDLRNSNPAFWPQLLQTYRVALEYRRRAAAKTQVSANDLPRMDVAAHTGERLASGDRTGSPARLENAAVSAPPAPLASPQAIPMRPAVAASDALQARHPPAADALPGGAIVPQSPAPVGSANVAPPAKQDATAAASASSAPSVTSPAPTSEPAALIAAIAELEQQTRDTPRDADAAARHVHLRLLYLVAGRRQDAFRPIAGLAPAQQEYWSNQLFALSTYLDTQRVTDPGRRAAEAALHLSKAAAALSDEGPLVVRNLTFCQEVTSFGVVKRCETPEFKPGEQVLIYAEVENFKSEQTTRGWHTSFEASYQLLDSQGQRVAKEDLPLTDEPDCQNRRRDYFIRYFVTLPKTIHDGHYTLELMVEDAVARKIGQSTIELTVKQKK
jgi:hypothetical protein